MPTPTRAGYTFKGWNGKNLFETGILSDYYIYDQSRMNVSISDNTFSGTIINGAMSYIINEKKLMILELTHLHSKVLVVKET